MQIVGHKKQIGYLNKILENKGQISHAFLFSGPEKIGKKTILLEFIKSIQCEKSGKIGELCGQCIGCEQIGRVSADFLAVMPAKTDDGGIASEIGIGAIRNLRNFMSTKPMSNRFKIALIDDAHLMTREAQNALLKILEEPSGDKIIFLISSSQDNLLPTILSRAYQMKFNFVAEEDIIESAKGDNAVKIKKIIKIFGGRPGTIEEFLSHREDLDRAIDEFFKFAASDTEGRFKYIEKIIKDKNLNAPALLEKWIMILRLALFQKVGLYDLMGDIGLQNYLDNFVSHREMKNISGALNLAQRLHFLSASYNINQRLAMEMLALEL